MSGVKFAHTAVWELVLQSPEKDVKFSWDTPGSL